MTQPAPLALASSRGKLSALPAAAHLQALRSGGHRPRSGAAQRACACEAGGAASPMATGLVAPNARPASEPRTRVARRRSAPAAAAEGASRRAACAPRVEAARLRLSAAAHQSPGTKEQGRHRRGAASALRASEQTARGSARGGLGCVSYDARRPPGARRFERPHTCCCFGPRARAFFRSRKQLRRMLARQCARARRRYKPTTNARSERSATCVPTPQAAALGAELRQRNARGPAKY